MANVSYASKWLGRPDVRHNRCGELCFLPLLHRVFGSAKLLAHEHLRGGDYQYIW